MSNGQELRAAAAESGEKRSTSRHTRAELREVIERLSDEQVRQVMTLVEGFLASSDPLFARLSAIPGVQMPAHWPPQFADFEPFPVEGEPVSEQLVRERR